MTRDKLEHLMQKYCIVDCELEDVINFVSDLLEAQADELKRTEPYAVNTIAELEHSAYNVYELLDYLEEMEK